MAEGSLERGGIRDRGGRTRGMGEKWWVEDVYEERKKGRGREG